MHKGTSPLFNPKISDEMKASVVDRLKSRYAYLAQHMEGKQYLMGDQFTVADGYLFAMLNWARNKSIEVGPVLSAYFDRVKAQARGCRRRSRPRASRSDDILKRAAARVFVRGCPSVPSTAPATALFFT